ncbi:leucine efflux protein LeuE [Agrococcus sp. ARC_14]|uniref:leucine efflux protein LeuE n=1 Tax=Agrococcus sp. ARC_14 TaxID=2919927 RepID=UPI001F070F8E|nr:leucine efflux protein LeuE [Agrococcus sp. ARC_14]MCH1883400.1 leucine efflux protein LeuE [Agrococcus sp. ARC_14]
MSLDAATLAAFTAGVVVIVLLPGANSLYVVATSLRAGRGAGFRAMLGVFLGDAILMVLAVLSAQALSANPIIFRILTWAGAAYLCWLALGLVRSALARIRAKRQHRAEPAPTENPTHPPTAPNPIIARPRIAPFRTALITSLLNPKAILFFASFFVQFIDPDSPTPLGDIAVLMVIAEAMSALYLAALVLVAARVGRSVEPHGWLAIVGTFVAAAAFVALAVRVVLP